MTEEKGQFLQLIEKSVSMPDVDVAKLQALLDMQERIMVKQAEISFNEAMARLQPKLPEIKKSSKAHNSKYAKYEHIERMVRSLYTAEGFSLRYNSEILDNGGEKYIGTLMHKDGHSVTASMVLPPDGSGSKNAIQAKGSTISYARRYLLCMLLNIVTSEDDDDGNAAGGVVTDDQSQKLKDLLRETGSNVKAFLELFGATDVDSIPEREFKKAHALLKTKKDGMK